VDRGGTPWCFALGCLGLMLTHFPGGGPLDNKEGQHLQVRASADFEWLWTWAIATKFAAVTQHGVPLQ